MPGYTLLRTLHPHFPLNHQNLQSSSILNCHTFLLETMNPIAWKLVRNEWRHKLEIKREIVTSLTLYWLLVPAWSARKFSAYWTPQRIRLGFQLIPSISLSLSNFTNFQALASFGFFSCLFSWCRNWGHRYFSRSDTWVVHALWALWD